MTHDARWMLPEACWTGATAWKVEVFWWGVAGCSGRLIHSESERHAQVASRIAGQYNLYTISIWFLWAMSDRAWGAAVFKGAVKRLSIARLK
jgi:hypothetical protein